jgi:serine phosphatase RsbU (regulator of sigma subunit)
MFAYLVIFLSLNLVLVSGEPTLDLKPVEFRNEIGQDTSHIISILKQIRKKYGAEKVLSTEDSLLLENVYKQSLKLNYSTGQVQYFDIHGVHERNRSNYSKALEYHNKALQLIEKQEVSREKAIVLNNIGVVYRRLDALNLATKFHLDALVMAEKLNDRATICVSLNSLGNINLALGRYDKALEYFSSALEKEASVNNTLGMAINYNNIGAVYKEKKEYARAIDYYNKSLDANKKIESSKGIAICYTCLGEIYLLMNKLPEAQEYLDKALEINKKSDDRIYTASSYIKLGDLDIKKKEYAEAIKNYNAGLEIAKKIYSKNYIYEAFSGLSQLYDSLEKPEKALYYYKLATSYKDSILNEEDAKDLNLKQVLYETGKKDKEIELLKYKQQIKDKKQKLIVALLIMGCFILLTLSLLFYWNYNLKQKANRVLIKYNKDIEEKNRLLIQQNEEIQSQRDEIEQKNIQINQAYETIKIKTNNITDNIGYAEQIQKALLPEMSLVNTLLPESFIFYKPKDFVSGDFYWIAKKGQRIILSIADCTGHGVTGAFMSILGITALNEIVIEKGVTATNEILNLMREKIIWTLQHGETFNESREGIHMVICSFDLVKKTMQFSGAINSIILIRQNQLLQYKGDKMPVSIYPDMEDFTSLEISLQKDDMVYLYTDGYYGQFGGSNDTKFSVFRFRNLIQKISTLSVADQQLIIENTFNSWKGETEQVDDILVMGVRV